MDANTSEQTMDEKPVENTGDNYQVPEDPKEKEKESRTGLYEDELDKSQANDLVHENSDLEENKKHDSDSEHASSKRTNQFYKNRLNQAQRERHRASQQANLLEQERQRLIQENEYLKNQVSATNKAALQFGDESAAVRLENARQKLIKSIESGDTQGQVDANTEISLATNDMQRFNTLKAQQELQAQEYYRQQQNQIQENNYYQNQHYQNYQNQQPEYQDCTPDEEERIYDWVEKNPWFDKNSSEFDRSFASHMDREIDIFNNALMQSNRGDFIYTREYFEALDDYVNDNREKMIPRSSKRDEIPMKNQSRNSYMAPTKGSSSVARTSHEDGKKRSLSKDALNLIRDLGVTEEEFRKSIDSTNKQDKLKGVRR